MRKDRQRKNSKGSERQGDGEEENYHSRRNELVKVFTVGERFAAP